MQSLSGSIILQRLAIHCSASLGVTSPKSTRSIFSSSAAPRHAATSTARSIQGSRSSPRCTPN
eukprot:9309982-Lingulodinium_polyedra.AAC.1